MNTLLARKNYIFSKAKSKFDNMILKYDGWFLVFLAVLLAIAFTISAALVIWCLTYHNKRFTFNWEWNLKGVSISAECV